MVIDTYTQLSVKDSPESDHLGTIIWKISRMYVIRAKGGGLSTLRTLNFLLHFLPAAGYNSSRWFAHMLDSKVLDQVKMGIKRLFFEVLYV